ncbi:retinin-like [Episyrphus balteatus]|uniref:retinin-like n=1 Tax=Episyrphus balteatus TaxID=286459 RepID=UPI0024858207|nr:retinin-like [Episyrphus balteatus]
MFKLVVLSALLAVAAARPGLLHSSPVVYSSPLVHEHGLASVGTIVKTIPTAVSHQSSSVVHSSGHIVQPIVAPVLKTYSAPVLHTSYVSSPLAYSAPHLSYASSPLHYASPYGYASGGW